MGRSTGGKRSDIDSADFIQSVPDHRPGGHQASSFGSDGGFGSRFGSLPRNALSNASSGRDLLAAYLDRREPGWRGDAQSEGSADAGTRPGGAGKMTEEEAYQILGIQPGASAEVRP